MAVDFSNIKPGEGKPKTEPAKMDKMMAAVGSSVLVAASVAEEQTVVATAPPVGEVETLESLTEDEVLTNEYIELYKKLEEMDTTPILKRMEDIKKRLQSIATEQVDPDQPALFTAPLGEIEFSKCSNVKVFDEPAGLLEDLVAKFGIEALNEGGVVKISVGALGKLLSENEMAQYYKEKKGSRSLKEVRPKKG